MSPRLIHENYNLTADGKMYGDGSAKYKYADDGQLEAIEIELIPYASLFKLPGMRQQPADSWRYTTTLINFGRTVPEVLVELLYTMLVRVSAHTYTIGFVSRRVFFDLILDKDGQPLEFLLIHENASFYNEPTFKPFKMVQDSKRGNFYTYAHGATHDEIIEDLKLQLSTEVEGMDLSSEEV
jgi:hypothetical protein